MKNFRITTLVLSLFITFFICSSVSASTKFTADHPAFHYTGRIDHTQPKQPYLTWPGSSIKFKITGDKLAITLNDDKGQNFYNIIFDQQNQYPYVLAAKKGLHTYDLSHMLSDTETAVEIFKRTEGAEGGSQFLGVKLADNGTIIAASPSSKRKISFYGDSVTVGMGNEAPHNMGDNNPAEKNHYLSYAPITARILDAEFHSIAKSGIGFSISWFDFIMPEYYDQLTAESNNQSQWDFNLWKPDVVVVNLGQNDSWLIDNEKRLKVTPQQIVNNYKNFIQTLRKIHPEAYFICALGSMDATKKDTWPNYIKRAIDEIKVENNTNKIDSVFFKFTGFGAHPRVDQHAKNAEKLSAFIKQKMHW